MKHLLRCLPVLILVFGLQARAQFVPAAATAIKGKFFVSVDDEASIFINGVALYQASLNESESPEFELKPGDRILVKLKNTLGKGRFMLLFMSTDRKEMVSFTPGSFRILPDPTVNDFTSADLAGAKKQAKAVQGDFAEPYLLPFKSSSKWVWGDVDVSSLGCIVTPQMVKPNTRN